MNMRQQLIVIGAVMFATIAVTASVFAGVRTVSARQQQPRAFTEIPITTAASTVTTTAGTVPHVAAPGLGSSEQGDTQRAGVENHGRVVAAFAAHIGFRDGVDGPPGALVRTIARPNVRDDGPPRSDRAEEHRNDSGNSSSSEHRQSGRGQSETDR